MDVDIGVRLMQLYQALRSARDPKEMDAIKAKIDALVAEAHAHFQSQPTGDRPPPTNPKWDA
jgi:hypothetical protein